MRHTGDRGVRVVRRGGKPIGEIGIDAEASPGQGQYYVKLYDGSVDLSGYDTAEEALDDIKEALGQKKLTELTMDEIEKLHQGALSHQVKAMSRAPAQPKQAAAPAPMEIPGVAESNELGQMLKHAGVLVKESMLTDSTGETLDHILNRFKNEVKRFQNGDEIDNELYDALFDYYNDRGDLPYGVAKARDGRQVRWISDKLTAELGIDENLIAAQSMPVTTESSSCNMTTEGEYCPEHGLAECGYMEDMAPVVMDEAPQDAINYNAAVTGSYYESKEGDALLARIKSLALLK